MKNRIIKSKFEENQGFQTISSFYQNEEKMEDLKTTVFYYLIWQKNFV